MSNTTNQLKQDVQPNSKEILPIQTGCDTWEELEESDSEEVMIATYETQERLRKYVENGGDLKVPENFCTLINLNKYRKN